MIDARYRGGLRACRHLLLGCVLALGACSGGAEPGEGETIARDAFISTFVDLRTVALTRGVRALPQEVRDSVLAAHGVSEQDLLDFVDIHGSNVKFMTAVWDSVEARLQPADSVAGGGTGDAATSR